MVAVDVEAFFAEHGYYPTTEAVPVLRKKSSSRKGGSTAPRIVRGHLALKGWRAPLHWKVPPAFEKPGLILENVGLETFKELVKMYYEAIGAAKVQRAEFNYDKWVVRALLRTFETHRRGFRRQEVSGRRNIGNGGGGVFVGASDIEQEPSVLVKDGRLLWDLDAYMSAYGVTNREFVGKLFKARLLALYGLDVT